MKSIFLALCLAASLMQATTWAHSGRTDKNGCHRDVKAGTRHCH